MKRPGVILAPGFFFTKRSYAYGLIHDVPVFHETVTALVSGGPSQQVWDEILNLSATYPPAAKGSANLDKGNVC